MKYDDFVKIYKPMQNPFEPDAPFDGYMFENSLKEKEFVLDHGLKNHHTVWTVVITDFSEAKGPEVTIISGFHFIDVHGFMITEKPFDEHIEVTDSLTN